MNEFSPQDKKDLVKAAKIIIKQEETIKSLLSKLEDISQRLHNLESN